MILIGDKSNFGIEIRKTKKCMGYAKIWLGGNSIGTFQDEIHIKGYLVEGLRQIAKVPILNFNKDLTNKTDIYYTLKKRLEDENDNNIHDYLIDFGTFCDDFTIFSFRSEDKIHVLWKLHNRETPFSDLNEMSNDVFDFNIDFKSYGLSLRKLTKEILGIVDCDEPSLFVNGIG